MNIIYKIKDSVDLFLTEDILTAYFMNTRIQKRFKVNGNVIRILETIDGIKSLQEISSELNISLEELLNVTSNMESKKIIYKVQNITGLLSKYEIKKFDRQLNYFGEFLETREEALIAHQKLRDTKFLLFGAGAIGGNIAIQLVMSGANNITLIDYDKVSDSDVSRHSFYSEKMRGRLKIDVLGEELVKINPDLNLKKVNEYIHPLTPLEGYIFNCDFVINSLDEPYIGYTSAKISRLCVPKHIPHFIAGGFDAHLASTGELIIPGVTPCVECYAVHFKKVLEGWKPEPHPVKNRSNEIGGLPSMSLFSSSYAVTEVIKYISGLISLDDIYKTRGELLFKDLKLTYINLDKDPDCKVCGKIGKKI
ncbi:MULTISPECIES: ThiF family adenylyltransferase [unclassified Exiguobacterium]|uniref:HesA/MoeB/ThiF family protein n=1 Tax=unclassified Exiguobacterium TaxID=2644629 RepID=UPI001BE733C8|nr:MULTISPECIES: ThiF family adenylyltransferase [unclassified Exiguobacterium]